MEPARRLAAFEEVEPELYVELAQAQLADDRDPLQSAHLRRHLSEPRRPALITRTTSTALAASTIGQ
ncbi:MAG TPA: hypothetical protein VNJ46_05705 [Gaiellaceae bacterium]|nr:hypothetical protein [Gaiellaceae bacterium]